MTRLPRLEANQCPVTQPVAPHQQQLIPVEPRLLARSVSYSFPTSSTMAIRQGKITVLIMGSIRTGWSNSTVFFTVYGSMLNA